MRLVKGTGSLADRAGCWMTAVSYYAGEEWSDHPECVCPVIATLCIALNDQLSDDDRERLIGPHLFAPVGTRSDRQTLQRRAWMVADVAVRVFAPRALEAAGMGDAARRLRGLARVRDAAAAAYAAAYAARAANAAANAANAAAAYAYAAAANAAAAAHAANAAAAAAAAAARAANAAAAYAYAAAANAAANAAGRAANADADVAARAAALLRLILRLCQIGDRREVVPARSKREVVAFLSD